ncbi:uncharacterized protein AKAME5_001486300 [Lates japonicus]|uniref:Uncharacterized protein n=1 Tax=Lates japonicus TaxID=270547 RepID=A0AAD3N086_LATJO|nr:uncharacterized protein AKAME5_001486300 [Lates japonicus]
MDKFSFLVSGFNVAPAGRRAHGPARYANAPTAFSFGAAAPGADYGDGPAPYENPSSAGFPSWGVESAGGVGAVFSDPRKWMPNRQFPDFGAWESNVGVPMSAGDSETSPLPPSSYIIQSMNGYEREREFLSHSKYSPEYPEPPPFPLDPVKAPSKLPRTVPKGGRRT